LGHGEKGSLVDEARSSTSSTEPFTAAQVAPRLHHVPSRAAVIYFAFGVCWIFFTDRILMWMQLSPERIAQVQTAKGWLFVVGSAALLYALLRRYQRQDEQVLQELVDSQTQIQRMNIDLEARVTERTRQLEAANRELEAFAYAVSHDLRAPLRSLSGFSQILRESPNTGLDEKSLHYLQRIHESSVRMSSLIEDLLKLSRITRAEFSIREGNLAQIANDAAAAIRERQPERHVQLDITPDMPVTGDLRLLRIAMDNLLDNAWKYSALADRPRIEVGTQQQDGEVVYFVRDNGVGFDMQYASKLFAPFQRLHSDVQFPGTGIGLVTVQRIIARHGGRIWVEAAMNAGATFYFTLGRQE
jgi:light-regulated signal transduction histidine kinase (bacteriophytochrome)